jgi:hypothetical protein
MKELITQSPWILYVLIAVCIGTLLSIFALFDYLVRWEFRHHRDAWEADGRPAGFFWRPFSTGELIPVTRSQVGFDWFFRTPTWVRENSTCRRVLLFYRLLLGTWISAGLFVLLYAFRH